MHTATTAGRLNDDYNTIGFNRSRDNPVRVYTVNNGVFVSFHKDNNDENVGTLRLLPTKAIRLVGRQ